MEPPRLCLALLRLLLPRSLRDEALDELADSYDARASREGVRAANRWYRRQVPGFVVRLWWNARSLRSAGPGVVHYGGVFMNAWTSDIRYAVRTLLRAPGFTFVAVLTLALGIGANTAIFSVVRTVLLRPLPFPEPERLVSLWETRLDRGWDGATFTHANFWDLRDMNRTFEAVGAARGTTINLTGFEYPEQLEGARVSADYFRALGAAPLLGRTFAAGEDQADADRSIVVLGHTFWMSRFGGDRGVVGRTITLDGASYAVIGVLPPGEPFLDDADVFVPLTRQADADRGSFELAVVGRLREGVSMEAAQADLDAISARLAAAYPEPDAGMGISMVPSSEWLADEGLRRALWVLMGGVGLLLVIACGNLANLLLARATGRTRERAVRTALGASHRRLARQTLTESLVMGGFGAGLGLAFAYWVVRLLRALQPAGIPRLSELSIDGWVLVFTAVIAILTGIATGMMPALRAPWRHLATALRESERGVGGSRRLGRLRSWLVGVEVAISVILLVGAGLLVASLREVLTVERGFDTSNRLFFSVALGPEYDPPRAKQFVMQIEQRLEAMSQVRSVAAVNVRPLRGVSVGMGYAAMDRPKPADDAVPWASWRLITPDYFTTLGVPLVAGRPFTPDDEIANPWRVLISQRIADELWPGENAVGRTISLWEGQSGDAAEVIGVVGDTRDWGLEDGPSRAVYMPYYGTAWSPLHFVAHTSGSPLAIAPALRSLLAELDPVLPLSNIQTFDGMVGQSLESRRFLMMLLVAFAVVAMMLALAGVYGVLSYSVARRRSEIGVRMALGSSRPEVTRLIVRQGMKPVVLGLMVGIGGALALSRVMTSMLFGITPANVPTYAGVATVLGAAALLSCWLPARRASAVSAMSALRQE